MVDFYLKVALLIILNTFMVSEQALATSIFSKHCPLGCPVSNDDNLDIVIHNTYISAINKKTKWTIWTSYEVDKKFFGKRKNHSFIADPLLPERLQKSLWIIRVCIKSTEYRAGIWRRLRILVPKMVLQGKLIILVIFSLNICL